MIGKIVTGTSFKGAVEYVLKKEGAKVLASDGVNTSDVREVIRSFNFQRKARPEMAEVVGHISLSFHVDDAPRLADEFMTTLAHEYMQRMGISDTQYIIARHTDTEHPHIHIIYNRVRYDAKLVRKHNERIRNVAVCKVLKQKYDLTFSEGKQNVRVEKLHGPDQVKYAIFGAVKEALPRCQSLAALADELRRQGIETTFVHRGGDPAKEIQGTTFTMDELTFKASQVDRKFSYANLCKTIEQNRIEVEDQQQESNSIEPDPAQNGSTAELIRYLLGEEYDPSKLTPKDAAKIAELERKHYRAQTPPISILDAEYKRQQAEEQARRITEIRGQKLTLEQQERLYSPQGIVFKYRENGHEYVTRFRPLRPDNGPDILTQEVLSEKKLNPTIFSVRLTDKQVETIRDGQYVYLEKLKYNDGTIGPGYLVMDDQLTKGRAFKERPDTWVKYGKYEMRLMDKLLIEAGFITRAVVKWDRPGYGYGQTARPYLWKEDQSDTTYKESWSDPRKSKNSQQAETRTATHVPSVQTRQEQQSTILQPNNPSEQQEAPNLQHTEPEQHETPHQNPEPGWPDDDIPQIKRGRRM